MTQALEVHRSGQLRDVPVNNIFPRSPLWPNAASWPRWAGLAPALPEITMKKESRLLRIGVLGCGPISQIAHFGACRKARNAELYAILRPGRRSRRQNGGGARAKVTYLKFDEMLADPQGRGSHHWRGRSISCAAGSSGHCGGQTCSGRKNRWASASRNGEALPLRIAGHELGFSNRQQPGDLIRAWPLPIGLSRKKWAGSWP